LIPFDRKRRGFQDRLARTLVIDAPMLSVAEQRRRQSAADRAEARLRRAGGDTDQSSDQGDDGHPRSREAADLAWRATPDTAGGQQGSPG
jgi:hypothetical protein